MCRTRAYSDGGRDIPTADAISLSYSLLKVFHDNVNMVWHTHDHQDRAARIIEHALWSLEHAHLMCVDGQELKPLQTFLPPMTEPHVEPSTSQTSTTPTTPESAAPDNGSTPSRYFPPEILEIIFSQLTKVRSSADQSTLAQCALVSRLWSDEAARLLWAVPKLENRHQLGLFARSVMQAERDVKIFNRKPPLLRKLDFTNVVIQPHNGADGLLKLMCFSSSLSVCLKDVRVRGDVIHRDCLFIEDLLCSVLQSPHVMLEVLHIESIWIGDGVIRNPLFLSQRFAKLKALKLSDLKPNGGDRLLPPSVIEALGPSLVKLDLSGSGTCVNDDVITGITKRCSSLQYLWLDSCGLGDGWIESLGQFCNGLKLLSLCCTIGVSKSGLAKLLPHARRLEYLNIQGITGPTAELFNLMVLHQLPVKGLWVDSMKSDMDALKALLIDRRQTLRYLDINKEHECINNDFVKFLAEHCTDYRYFGLATLWVTVDDETVRHLMKSCPQLEALGISRTRSIVNDLEAELEEKYERYIPFPTIDEI
ncbi:hypothetical protein SeMB42_g01819 [Synchytrium endobioticum]|uniref:Uncharacterized protein n=1 Tax=Synchytrium endobioticum TaxID=286115 RepID=A0A507DJH2_9FUNG|nr:hypothetical protein SeMB42_g01819 [Synchytrium endobioticum]